MRHIFRTRMRIVMGGILLFTVLLLVRLYFVQIVHGEDYALRAEHQYTNATSGIFDRGTIYFTRKDGTLISAATLATGFTLAINPEQIKNPETVYQSLAPILPTLDHDLFIARATKQNDPYEEIAYKVPEDTGTAIAALKLPGILLIRERWRMYPAGALAAQTLGFIAQSDEDTTLQGRYGLERSYDYVLSRDGDSLFGNFFAELFANLNTTIGDPRHADEGDIVTSIEPVVQQKLTETLQKIQNTYHSQETGGIIMDPKTGAIVALDSVPSFDPNDFTTGDPQAFGNRLVERRYEFGSIVKALTMASGLDAGVITPESTYNDAGCITVDTKRICNHDMLAPGRTSMQEILSKSLNVGASWIASRLGHDTMRSYFTKLGLDTTTGVDIPSELPSTIANLTDRDVNYFTASFGQGIATTPVGMIRALGALADDGKTVVPHLVTGIRLESGITRPLSWGDPVRVFSPTTAATVSGMLVTAVDMALLNGSAKTPEMSVAAKTGTAQISDPAGGYYADRYFHSFFGYFPAYDPRFIILLYTKDPRGVQYSSETLTGSFVDLVHFLTNYYAIPPDRASYETTS